VGLRENFTETELEADGIVAALIAGTNTPGNNIERHMGHDMFFRVGTHYTLRAINIAISGRFNSLSHYCDVLPFSSNGSCNGRGW